MGSKIADFISKTRLKHTLSYSLILLVSLSSSLYSQDTNIGKGVLNVLVRTSSPPIERSFDVKIDVEICGNKMSTNPVNKDSKNGLANVLLWLEGEALKNQSYNLNQNPELKIKNCQFQDEFIFVPPKSPLRIESADPINFDLKFSRPGQAQSFRSLPPNLKEVTIEFEKAGIVEISCTLHPWMKSFIVIPSHPQFGVTNKNGSLRFQSVPSGSYQLHLWHGVLGMKTYPRSVEISQGVNQLEIDWEDI